MAISDKQLDTFITLYERNFGITLDRQTAYEQAVKLIRLVKLTCYEKIPARCKIDAPDTNKEFHYSIECNEG